MGVLAGLFLTVVATPSRGETFTLADALSLAYETNPQLAQARAALWALDQGVDQANAHWRPTVNATITQGYDRGFIAGFPNPTVSKPLVGQVTVTEPIFRGGRTVAEINQAIAQVHAGRAQLLQTEETVLLDAVTAYMDVVRDTEKQQINRDNVSSLETELSGVQKQLQAGVITKPDLAQAEARLQRGRADEALAESRLAASRAAFEDVIGRPAPALEDAVALPAVPASQDAALALALKQNPTVDQAKANERASSYAVDDAVGALLPQLSVSGQYQYLRNAPSTSVFGIGNSQHVESAMAQLDVPIYQGGGEEATVRRAKDLHAQAELAIVSAEHNVQRDLHSVWGAIQTLETSIAANRAQFEADEQAASGIQLQQKGGERSVLDVLNAQQELYVAQVALADAEHDHVVAVFRLLSVTGQLTAQYLKLKAPVYDPEVHYEENANAWFGFEQ